MNTIESIQKRIRPILESNDVSFAGVFGSYARGEAKSTSDIDLLVRFRKPKSLLGIVAFERELSEILKTEVEVITEQSLHPYIAPYVRKELRTIYEG